MRTRQSICERKQRFVSVADAMLAAGRDSIVLRPYRCDRCGHYHLTSRTKGKWVPVPRTAADTPLPSGS